MIAEASNNNLPTIFDIVEPIIEEAPSTLQNDLTDLIVALYRASANETAFLLKHILTNAQNPMTVVTLRRIAPNFPPPLQKELRDLLRSPSLTEVRRVAEEPADFVVDEVQQKRKRRKWTTRKSSTCTDSKAAAKRKGAPVCREIPRHGHARFHWFL